jgi:protein-tyrosine phosphatase
VLTHCAHGVNRGPSLAYAILRAQGWPRHDAYALLKERRPQVRVGYRDDADAALRALRWTRG